MLEAEKTALRCEVDGLRVEREAVMLHILNSQNEEAKPAFVRALSVKYHT
jgi:hypothetical protein